MVTDWMEARQFQMIEHLPDPPDLARGRLFPLRKGKEGAGQPHPHQRDLQEDWEGAARTLKAADFATAFRRWYECCEKCINIAGSYVEKSFFKNHVSIYNRFIIDILRVLNKHTQYTTNSKIKAVPFCKAAGLEDHQETVDDEAGYSSTPSWIST
jgi:hypothetical protein